MIKAFHRETTKETGHDLQIIETVIVSLQTHHFRKINNQPNQVRLPAKLFRRFTFFERGDGVEVALVVAHLPLGGAQEHRVGQVAVDGLDGRRPAVVHHVLQLGRDRADAVPEAAAAADGAQDQQRQRARLTRVWKREIISRLLLGARPFSQVKPGKRLFSRLYLGKKRFPGFAWEKGRAPRRSLEIISRFQTRVWKRQKVPGNPRLQICRVVADVDRDKWTRTKRSFTQENSVHPKTTSKKGKKALMGSSSSWGGALTPLPAARFFSSISSRRSVLCRRLYEKYTTVPAGQRREGVFTLRIREVVGGLLTDQHPDEEPHPRLGFEVDHQVQVEEEADGREIRQPRHLWAKDDAREPHAFESHGEGFGQVQDVVRLEHGEHDGDAAVRDGDDGQREDDGPGDVPPGVLGLLACQHMRTCQEAQARSNMPRAREEEEMAPVTTAIVAVARLRKVMTLLTMDDSLTPNASRQVMTAMMAKEKKSGYSARVCVWSGIVSLKNVEITLPARASTEGPFGRQDPSTSLEDFSLPLCDHLPPRELRRTTFILDFTFRVCWGGEDLIATSESSSGQPGWGPGTLKANRAGPFPED
ncbi:Elongation factor 1-alpha [Frankliniella fusca]|uniref:Elongation factor 1-alpha n=1 Tax=Frankliniella fusca TaxID=407009 RepID=A0AAE1HZW4_9NEOP|nr:Elongation factor 1-alpha [Frankliniella fusca]